MFPEIPYPYSTILEIAITIIVAAISERVVTRYLKRFSERRELPPEVGNGLVLIARFLIIVGAVITLFRVGGLSTEWFTAISALAGAAIGFSSTKTLGNFIAGLYILIARPFRVQDYVSIAGTEGIVKEITINYTKILTPGNTTVSMTNQKILDQDIINYRYKSGKSRLYCYSFELSFDHSLPTNKLEKTFDKVIKRYEEKLPRKPEYGMTKLMRLERHYMFYLYFKNPKDIFTQQPTFLKEITKAWDKAKASSSS